MTTASQPLRDAIRAGTIECRPGCDSQMCRHVPGCPWQWAIEQIYRLERAAGL